MGTTKKEIAAFRRERAGWEFNIRLAMFLEGFKSKEEPTIKLTPKEIGILLLRHATAIVERETLK